AMQSSPGLGGDAGVADRRRQPAAGGIETAAGTGCGLLRAPLLVVLVTAEGDQRRILPGEAEATAADPGGQLVQTRAQLVAGRRPRRSPTRRHRSWAWRPPH